MLTRQRVPELMDDPALDPLLHKQARIGLRRLNALGRTSTLLWRPIHELFVNDQPLALRVLDLACGSGETAIDLWKRARSNRCELHVSGCDFSEVAIKLARENANNVGASVDFFMSDVLQQDLPQGFDVVTASLFTHHLSEDEVITLMRRMKSGAAKMVVISDLERTSLNYILVWLATRLVTTSPVVHFDGPASVRNAYTADEFRSLAARAGLDGAVVYVQPPCRMMLIWRR